MPLRIQVLSDLHVEFDYYRIKIVDTADVVLMAGDFGVAQHIKNLARFAGSTDRQIIFVAGNHDYYGGIIKEVDQMLTQTSLDYANFHFLNDSSFRTKDVEFIGCTLWSNFDLAPDPLKFEWLVQMAINDFDCIKTSPENVFTPQDCRRLNEHSRRFLQDTLHSNFKGKRVIVTHFLPSQRSIHAQYNSSLINPYFCCNCESLMGPDVALWVHGHTHSSMNYQIAGTRVVANPRGYYGENKEFDGKLVIEL
jgi:predicted phosphodiesterase